MKHRILSVTIAIVFLVTLIPGEAGAEAEFHWSNSIANRYVTEGIDNDPDSSGHLFSELSMELGEIVVGAWYAQSLRGSSMNEINLFAEYGFALGGVDFHAGLNYLTFPTPDDPDSWEVFLGFAYGVQQLLVLYGETYYDIDEVRGGFLVLGMAFPFHPTLSGQSLGITPYAQLGIDYGFVSGPRSLRENNFQVGLEATYAVSNACELFGNVNHSIRLSNLRDEGEGNVIWMEAGLRIVF